jgi:alkyl hydroperoxide reductase subunit AhpC
VRRKLLGTAEWRDHVATLLTERTVSSPARHNLTSPSLRAWLREDWAILFSHPDDFVSYDIEMDRWLVIARRAFAERHIRPIALSSPTANIDRSWVTQISGDERTVLLEDASREHFGPVDLQAPVLHEKIEQTSHRFVMIIDSALRIQKMFNYQPLSDLPSPLELLGWADALRAKQAARQVAAVQTGSRASTIQVHPVFAARRHKHRIPQVACTPALHTRTG